MPVNGSSSKENPNICPACARLIAELAEGVSVNEIVEAAATAQAELEVFAPETASMFGGTFIWQEKI